MLNKALEVDAVFDTVAVSQQALNDTRKLDTSLSTVAQRATSILNPEGEALNLKVRVVGPWAVPSTKHKKQRSITIPGPPEDEG